MFNLPEVTLIGIDCLDVVRLQLAFDISTKDINFGAVKLLTSIPTDDLRAIKIEPLLSIDAYSDFCLRDLYKYVDTPYTLIIQYDGFILNTKEWSDDFLKYDYIGAPFLISDWTKEKHGVPDNLLGNLLVGNGGFSLRSKKLLDLTSELAKNNLIKTDEAEDWTQCYTYRELLEEKGIKFASVAVAENFSFEGRSKDYFHWKKSFGFHSLKWTDLSLWLEANPEYKSQIKNQVEVSTFE